MINKLLKFTNINPEIPLGTNLFKQKISQSDIPTVESVDTINVSTDIQLAANYVVKFEDNAKVSCVYEVEITKEKPMQFIDNVNVECIGEIQFNPQKYEMIFREDIQTDSEGSIQTFAELIFEDNITLSEESSIINISPAIIMNFEDTIYANDINEVFYYGALKGDIVLENTIRNKYSEESFADFTVTPGKSYIYTFRTYNDLGLYTDIEKEIIVSEEELVNTVGNAIIKLSNIENTVKLFIDDPSDKSWVKTEIYRSLNPISIMKPEELILTYAEKDKYNTNGYSDKVEYGKTYYYKAFTYSDNYVNKSGENKSITIKIPSESIPPSPINNLTLIPENNSICYLNWNDPPELDWIKTVIVRKENEPPLNPNDGTIMTINTERNKYASKLLEVSTPLQETKYYFKAFPYNDYTYNHLGNHVEVQTIDNTPPENLIVERINYVNYKVNIGFTITDSTTIGVKIKRFETRDDAFYSRGEEIIDLITNKTGEYVYTDTTTKANTTYYYRCYPYDKFNNINDNGKILECFTEDTRISSITNLNIEQDKEDLIITWTNPDNQYFLNTEIYYSNVPISNVSSKTLLCSNSQIGNVKMIKSIHELNNHGNLYFLAVPVDYKGNKFFNGEYNIQRSINDTTPPTDISEFNVIQNEKELRFTWISSDSVDWESETLVCKMDSEPETVKDGYILTVSNTKNNHVLNPFVFNIDTGVHYFKIFPRDKYGNYNNTCIPIKASYDKPTFNEGVKDFSINLIGNDVQIKWSDPSNILWGATKVIRNDRHIPTDHMDGETVLVSTERNKYSINPYLDRNLTLNTRYHYAIYTRDKDGIYSDQVSKESILIRDNVPPSAVQTLNIEKLDNGIGLTWKDTDDYDWKGCKLIKSTFIPEHDSEGELLIDNSIKNRFEVTPFVDNNIEVGVTYYYRVFTYDIYGNTTPSNYITYIMEDTTPPGIVINFNVEQVASSTGAKLLFKWEDPNDSDWNYTKICYSTNDVLESDNEVVKVTEKNKHVNKPFETTLMLTPGLTYKFKAFTCDFNGNINDSCQTLSLTIMDNVNIGDSVIKGEYNNYSIELNVDDDQTKDFDGCVIIKSNQSISTISNGEILIEYATPDKYSVTKIVDKEIQPYNRYYYKAFPYKMFGSTKIYNNNCNEINILIESVTPPNSAPLSANQVGNYIYLDWELDESYMHEYYVIKNTNHMPSNETDGELIAHNIGGYRVSWYKDYDITPNTTYYYRSFVKDKYGNWNRDWAGLSITTSMSFPLEPISDLRIFHFINEDEHGYHTGSSGIGMTWSDPQSDSWVETKITTKLNGTPTILDKEVITTNYPNRYQDNPLVISDGKYGLGDSLQDKTYHFTAFSKDTYDKSVLSDELIFKFPKEYFISSGYRDKYDGIFAINAGDFGVGSNGVILGRNGNTYSINQAWYNKFSNSLQVKTLKNTRNIFYNKQMSFLDYYKAKINGQPIIATPKDNVLMDISPLEYNPDLQSSVKNEVGIDKYLVKGKVNVIAPTLQVNVENYNTNKLIFKVNNMFTDYSPSTCVPCERDEGYAYYEFDNGYLYIFLVQPNLSRFSNSYTLMFGYKTTPNGSENTIKWLYNEKDYTNNYLVDFDFETPEYHNYGNDGGNSVVKMFKIPTSDIPDTIYLTGYMKNYDNPYYHKNFEGCNITINK